MRIISKKEIKANIDQSLAVIIARLEIETPSKKTSKLLKRVSKKLSSELKDDLKKQFKKMSKAGSKEKVIGKAGVAA